MDDGDHRRISRQHHRRCGPAGCHHRKAACAISRAENPLALEATRLSGFTIAGLRSSAHSLDIRATVATSGTPMRISEEGTSIIFANLADSATRRQHGARVVATRLGKIRWW
jgi:hypothetical protein